MAGVCPGNCELYVDPLTVIKNCPAGYHLRRTTSTVANTPVHDGIRRFPRNSFDAGLRVIALMVQIKLGNWC